MDITELRQQIDQVDRSLVALFIQRMEISSQIADYKKEQNIPIFDPDRERSKLKDVASKVSPELESSVQVLYSLLFELSRSYQNEKNAAQTPLYQQISHAIDQTAPLFPPHTTIACQAPDERLARSLERISKSAAFLTFQNSTAICEAVAQGLCPYGLLALDGPNCYDLLREHHFYIVRSLRVLRSNGQWARFVLFGKTLQIYPGADRTTLALVLPNKPGSLYRILARLYTLGLNVTKLDSRPIAGDDFKILFYFDLETSIYSQEFVKLMCQLEDLCDEFEYLGSYSEVF